MSSKTKTSGVKRFARKISSGKVTPQRDETSTSVREVKPTIFRKLYQRGDLPIAMEHNGLANKIFWKVIMCYFSLNFEIPITRLTTIS